MAHLEYLLIVVFILLFVGILAVTFVDGIVTHFIEPFYTAVTHKPLYVHFYPRRKRLEFRQVSILQRNAFYRRLSEKQKLYFEHRVAKFLETYRFFGKDGLVVTEEMRMTVASVYVMLTFGMRHYLVDTFRDILLYPDVYRSRITDKFHKGEFNPKFKVVVFSWPHFLDGLERDDNVNLGIHEFAHVLHFNSRKRRDNSAANFAGRFDRLVMEVNHPPNRERLMSSGYFRNYAYTNQHEFLAVVLEHFFETPSEFRRNFPELYLHISRMINLNH